MTREYSAIEAIREMRAHEGTVMACEKKRRDRRNKLYRYWNGKPESRQERHEHWHIGFALLPEEVTAKWRIISE